MVGSNEIAFEISVIETTPSPIYVNKISLFVN